MGPNVTSFVYSSRWDLVEPGWWSEFVLGKSSGERLLYGLFGWSE